MSGAALKPFFTADELAKAIEKDVGFAVDVRLLDFYAKEVLEKGKQFNLTGHGTIQEVYAQLFYDSLFPYASLKLAEGARVLDVGSGSGVPGLLLAMVFPKAEISIVEASAKKSGFVKEVARQMRLANLTVLNQRAEDLQPGQRESFDFATARAVAALNVLLELLAPFVKVGGTIVCPKSAKYDEEKAVAAPSLPVLGLKLVGEDRMKSVTGLTHVVATYAKIRPTPAAYPRSWSKIKSEPIR